MTDSDPLMLELFRKVPPPGSVWPLDQRMLWLDACEAALNLIYGPVEKIDIPALFIRTGASPEAIERLKRSPPGHFVPIESSAESEVIVPSPAAPPKADPPEPDVPEIKVGDVVTEPDGPLDGASITAALEGSRLAPRGAGGGRGSNRVSLARPESAPPNWEMVVAALKELGPSSGNGLREYIRKRWWPDVPNGWSGCLYSYAESGKLERDGINFKLPTKLTSEPPPAPPAEDPPPPSPQPAAPAREVSSAAARFAERRARSQLTGSTSTQIIADDLPEAPPPKPTPPQPPKVVAPPPGATHAFGYADKTIMLSLKEHRILSKLKAAMGKGMLEGMHLVSVAFAGEAAKVSNSEVYLREVMEQLGPRLDILGLEMVGVPTMPGSSRIAGYVLRAK